MKQNNIKEEIISLLRLNIDDEKVIEELTTLIDKVREEALQEGYANCWENVKRLMDCTKQMAGKEYLQSIKEKSK